MRVVEPQQFKGLPKKPKKHRTNRPILLLVACLILVSLAFFGWKQLSKPKDNQKSDTVVPITSAEEPATQPAKTRLKTFTGEQFKELYRSMAYPNTIPFTDIPNVTGVTEADKRIRELAEARGYKLTSIPAGAIVKINEPRLDGDDLLQPLAATSWQKLKEAAKKENIPLALISAYRSPEYQKNLFTSRLFAKGVTVRDITTNAADAAINQTLSQAAVPGYSRHHTGYTVDLWCEDGSGQFVYSSCFRWIKANNYQKAKESGWIPSYPEGASEQGPEPEPWEYVWVGTDALYE